jgi:radical SAM superfamily enzyme YgiQ (UPF0313 family)
MLQNIPWMVNGVRKSGLTMAVEAANDDMRAAIRKHVTDGNLLDGVKQAYEAGWRTVKLYFMCGFPGERPEDIDGIVELSRKVSQTRRELGKAPGQVNASVGWLVPKPYTPFQWAAQPTADYFHEARRRMAGLLYGFEKPRANPSRDRNGAASEPPTEFTRRVGVGADARPISPPRIRKPHGPVKLKTHNVERSILEAVFARGDRRLSEVIERAYRAGARFDGWDECFNHRLWQESFHQSGIDPAWYAHRERSPFEVFPWHHLHGGPDQEYLARQYDDVFTQINVARPLVPVPA